MNTKVIHVAVGVIRNADGKILIARRPDHLHQGGLWEFPGGKVNKDEDVKSALARELHEELGIRVKETAPLITIPHTYADKRVYLDVHVVSDFEGQTHGKEAQEVLWVEQHELANYDFPEANKSILSALNLPDQYLITGKFKDFSDCEQKIRVALDHGICLIQLREKEMQPQEFIGLANRLHAITFDSNAILVLNTSVEIYEQTSTDGIHMTGERLRSCQKRPVDSNKLFSVSTHTLEELQHASNIGADFAMLSPVLPTKSHPGEPALGWDAFSEIVRQVNIPVYALGGMTPEYVETARDNGAQGIAAITALWDL